MPPKKLGELLGPELGFVSLAAEPGLLVSSASRRRYSPFDRGVEHLEPDAFETFDEPGHVKAGDRLRAPSAGRRAARS